MRQLATLVIVYAVVAALVLPASPLAADDPPADPAAQAQAEAGTEPGAPAEAGVPPAAAGTPPDQTAPSPAPAAQAEEAAPKLRARAAAPGSVVIRDFSFTPRSITVNVGETVTWRNTGDEPHSATATDGSFDTGTFRGGQSRSQRFAKAGLFAYICTPHPFMKGTVRVVAAGSGGSAGSGSGSTAGAASDDGAGSSEAGTAGSSAAGSSSGGSSRSGAALPNSGAEAEALALLGGLLLVLGAAIRRREARGAITGPAGRIGW